eukprot:2208019-Prymnesium_polylepis.1
MVALPSLWLSPTGWKWNPLDLSPVTEVLGLVGGLVGSNTWIVQEECLLTVSSKSSSPLLPKEYTTQSSRPPSSRRPHVHLPPSCTVATEGSFSSVHGHVVYGLTKAHMAAPDADATTA